MAFETTPWFLWNTASRVVVQGSVSNPTGTTRMHFRRRWRFPDPCWPDPEQPRNRHPWPRGLLLTTRGGWYQACACNCMCMCVCLRSTCLLRRCTPRDVSLFFAFAAARCRSQDLHSSGRGGKASTRRAGHPSWLVPLLPTAYVVAKRRREFGPGRSATPIQLAMNTR